MLIKRILLFCLMLLLSLVFVNKTDAYTWNFTYNEEGWTGRNGTYVDQTGDNGGQLTVNTVGNDPGIVSPNLSLNASSNNLLKMRVATFCSNKNATVYFKRSGSSTVYTGGTTYYSSGGSWGTYEVNMSGNSNWTGTITQIRIDPSDSCGSPSNPGFIAFNWIETTSIPLLSPPNLLSPINGQTVYVSSLPGTVTLQWQSVSGNYGYNLLVDGIPVNNVSGTSYNATLNSGSHNWQACTRNSAGVCGSWSSLETFYVQLSTLSPPNLLSPINGQTVYVSNLPGTVTLQWQSVSGNYGYNLLVDGIPINNVSGTSYNATLNSGSHNWQACTRNSAGVCGSWSPLETFNIQLSTLSPPNLLSPINGQTVYVSSLPGTVTLQWQSVSGNYGYNLLVDGIAINNVSGTSYNATLNSGSHNWQACTRNSAGVCGSWSPLETFNIQLSTLSPPNLISPVGGETVYVSSLPGTVPLNWSQISGNNGYQVVVDGMAPMDMAVNQISYDATLNEGAHNWKVCAKNGAGICGSWSTLETFNVSEQLPTISNVQVNPVSATNGDTLTVSWDSTNQNHWFIYLYDSTGTSPVDTSSFLSANCSAGGSDGSDGCLDQANPSSDKSTTWTVPAGLMREYTIKVKVWNSLGQPPAGVGSVSNIFVIWKAGTPPADEQMGVLARIWNNADVYWIKYGKKWPLLDWDTLLNLGYTAADVEWYGSGAIDGFALGKTILLDNDNFVYRKQSVSTVYIVRNGVSDWFFNWDAFINSEFGTEDVYWAKDAGFDWIQSVYPLGQMIGLMPRIRVEPNILYFK